MVPSHSPGVESSSWREGGTLESDPHADLGGRTEGQSLLVCHLGVSVPNRHLFANVYPLQKVLLAATTSLLEKSSNHYRGELFC